MLVLTGLSLAACCLVFPPIGWWWLGYVCLVPWLICVCTAEKSRFVYFVSLLLGLGFFLINCQWMIQVTLPGYFALCLGFSVVFPLAAWPIRHMYRAHGASIALTTPVVWVTVEYLRSISDLGFPFLLLGHSQYQNLTMIQISDLVGAYGVSFVLAMINGWIADLLIQPILIWRAEHGTRLPVGSLTTLVVVLGTVIYGSAQRSTRYFTPGPKIAVVQHDFPMYVDADRAGRTHPKWVFEAYLALARRAAADQPDLIILPETAMQGFVNDEFLEATPGDLQEILKRRYPPHWQLANLKAVQAMGARIRNAFQRLSTESGVPLVLGSSALEWKPTDIPPRVHAFNSAFLIKPGQDRPVARYDKMHLVLFGEVVPFRRSWPWLYDKLNAFTPWGSDGRHYSLTPGSEYTIFEFDAAGKSPRPWPGGSPSEIAYGPSPRPYRAAVPICYEEVMPYIAREFTRGHGRPDDKKNIDILLSISNDGWFLHSSELEQHLVSGVFRAVENRIAVARSVNTGASAIIHPNGKIHHRVTLSEEKIAQLEPVAALLGRLRETTDRLEAGLDSEDEPTKPTEPACDKPARPEPGLPARAAQRTPGMPTPGAEYTTEYAATLQELNGVLSGNLSEALAALGPEFAFMEERLHHVMFFLAAKNHELRREAMEDLRAQIDDDLNTIERWKKRPWTAPGYTTAVVKCDNRLTVYSRWGDWFAQGAVALFSMMLLDWLLRRFLRRKATAGRDEG